MEVVGLPKVRTHSVFIVIGEKKKKKLSYRSRDRHSPRRASSRQDL